MSTEYTPATEAVRNAYVRSMREAFVAGTGEAGAEFDRWLTAHDAEARSQPREITDGEIEAAGEVLYESWASFDFDDDTDDWARGIRDLVRAALEAAEAARD